MDKAKPIGNDAKVTITEEVQRVNAAIAGHYPRVLHKELWGWQDKQANNSLYRWWWEFLRASRDFPKVRKELETVAKADIDAVDTDFGLLGDDFDSWWKKTGIELFAEKEIPLIQVLKPEPDNKEYLMKTGVVLVVPMTIRRELIIDQINLMLDIYHPGDDFRRHEFSTAKRKIFPKQRYKKIDYELMINIWRKKQEDLATGRKEKYWWQIYNQAVNDDKKKVSATKKDLDTANKRIVLGKLAEKLYTQAEAIIRNAIRGEFPNDKGFVRTKRKKKTKKVE